MDAKKIALFTLLREGFKKIEISEQLNVSRITVHRMEQRLISLEFLKDLPRSRRPQVISQDDHQKGLQSRQLPENDKTDTEEENSSLHWVQDRQNDERKKSEMFQEAPVESSNGSEASGGEHPFVE